MTRVGIWLDEESSYLEWAIRAKLQISAFLSLSVSSEHLPSTMKTLPDYFVNRASCLASSFKYASPFFLGFLQSIVKCPGSLHWKPLIFDLSAVPVFKPPFKNLFVAFPLLKRGLDLKVWFLLNFIFENFLTMKAYDFFSFLQVLPECKIHHHSFPLHLAVNHQGLQIFLQFWFILADDSSTSFTGSPSFKAHEVLTIAPWVAWIALF